MILSRFFLGSSGTTLDRSLSEASRCHRLYFIVVVISSRHPITPEHFYVSSRRSAQAFLVSPYIGILEWDGEASTYDVRVAMKRYKLSAIYFSRQLSPALHVRLTCSRTISTAVCHRTGRPYDLRWASSSVMAFRRTKAPRLPVPSRSRTTRSPFVLVAGSHSHRVKRFSSSVSALELNLSSNAFSTPTSWMVSEQIVTKD